ncbi:MAG: hypothetical protein ACI8TX_001290 [Hyphomicrobiaceae bacterium]|jgi:hypothetical protein
MKQQFVFRVIFYTLIVGALGSSRLIEVAHAGTAGPQDQSSNYSLVNSAAPMAGVLVTPTQSEEDEPTTDDGDDFEVDW